MSAYSVQEMVRYSERPLLLIPTTSPIGTILPTIVNEKKEPRWVVTEWKYKFATEPFDISLNDFLQLGYEDVVNLQAAVRQRCSQLIEDEWKKGKRQLVICDKQVVFSTEDIEDIPNEKIRALAEQYKKPCYTFAAPDLVEESGWTMVDSDDHYPTLGLYVGAEDSTESSFPENFFPVEADFDTGNPNLKVFDANQLGGDLAKFDALDLRQTEHHGKTYTYFQKKVRICVKDEEKATHSFVARVRLVKDWAGCGLLQFSPNRTGFVGRDVMRLLGLRIELDPTKRLTRLYPASS